MSLLMELARGSLDALMEYLSAHVLTCLVPAFFIAGAIAVFVSQAAVLKYFGPQAMKYLSYGVASVSGMILTLNICTLPPLSGGIYRWCSDVLYHRGRYFCYQDVHGAGYE